MVDMNGIYSILKRFFDIILSALGLILLLPLFISISIAIKIDSKGPVFFTQRRTGKNGRVFRIYKFRTMSEDNDVHDTTCRDKRTRVGNALRVCSLDELPQLWNVLKGDMSIVGPRPWVTDYLLYMAPADRRRFRVRPGITGLAQVSGRNNIGVHEKIRYDIEYIDRLSSHFGLLEDLKVVARTIKSLLFPNKSEVESSKNLIYSELDELKWPGISPSPTAPTTAGLSDTENQSFVASAIM